MAPQPPSHAALLLAAATIFLLLLFVVQAAADEGGGVAYCNGGDQARRKLGWGNSNIGYDALRRNSVPCSYRGASYYNCRPGAQANPYSRGCSAIARCRDG